MKLTDLLESSNAALISYLKDHYMIIDRDMGNVVVIYDHDSDWTYEVLTNRPVQVHPHTDNSSTPNTKDSEIRYSRRAEEIRRELELTQNAGE